MVPPHHFFDAPRQLLPQFLRLQQFRFGAEGEEPGDDFGAVGGGEGDVDAAVAAFGDALSAAPDAFSDVGRGLGGEPGLDGEGRFEGESEGFATGHGGFGQRVEGFGGHFDRAKPVRGEGERVVVGAVAGFGDEPGDDVEHFAHGDEPARADAVLLVIGFAGRVVDDTAHAACAHGVEERVKDAGDGFVVDGAARHGLGKRVEGARAGFEIRQEGRGFVNGGGDLVV